MTVYVSANLVSLTPYSQSKYIPPEKKPKETHEDYEARIWQKRMHWDEDTDEVYVPPMALKNALSDAAKYLSIQIPGKGKATYTKHFEAGVICAEPMGLGVKWQDVPCDILHVPSDGRRGGSTRVIKHFPKISKWKGVAKYIIVDETITRDVFERVLRESGNLIGIGRFRPRNNGYYGRFFLDSLEWVEED